LNCCCARTRFELARRRAQLRHVGVAERDHLAAQAADDALMAILGKLDDFRGTSRFTTCAYKFALLEAGVKGAPAGVAGP
jgi:RNA polymerase sigma-70 factor, ECF subfamily